MNIKESLKNFNFPTPTLAVTDIGVLAIAPQLIKEAQMIFAGVELGMNLDDFWDFGVDPRPIHKTDKKENHQPEDYYNKYFESLKKIIERINQIKDEKEQQRQKSNLSWFVASINHLEGETISKEESYWKPETVQKYREGVALVWAMFLAAMTPGSDVLLREIANQKEHLSLEDCYNWMNSQVEEQALERIYTRRLLYGALVFQVISDHGKRHFAKEQFIPSFGGVGFESHNDQELEEYIQKTAREYMDLAVKAGVEPNVLQLFATIFPKIQKFLKNCKKTKKVCEWAYS